MPQKRNKNATKLMIAFFNLNEVYKAGQTGVAIVKVSVQSNNLYDETVVELNEGIDNKADLILQ